MSRVGELYLEQELKKQEVYSAVSRLIESVGSDQALKLIEKIESKQLSI